MTRRALLLSVTIALVALAFAAAPVVTRPRIDVPSALSDAEFWRNYVLLQVFDRLSLWLCKGDPAGTGAMRIALPDGGELAVTPTEAGCALRPYPFLSEPLRITVPVRTVPLTGWANDADCAAGVISAHVDHRIYEITAG